jgi:hypothetical protein
MRRSRIVVEIPTFTFDPRNYIFTMFFTNNTNLKIVESFFTEKEARDKQISIDLRTKDMITISSKLFELFRRKEINRLW